MLKSIFTLFMCSMVSSMNAQSSRELKIGDTLPAVNVSYLAGDSVITVPLKTFYKDNYLIIDFWATWCGVCIRMMANADSVVSNFKSSVKILPITYEEAKPVKEFILKNKVLSKMNLKFVVNDSLLMGGYIKFNIVPHEVWINPKGVICAITYPDEITSENVRQFVNGQPMALKEKVDNVKFDPNEPLQVDNSSILYRSILAPYKSGISSYIGSDAPSYKKDAKYDRFMATNSTILSLFYAAYSQNQGRIKFKNIELDVKDTFSLCPYLINKEVSRQVLMQKEFCYELILPQKVSKQYFHTYLMNELNGLFSFYGSTEKRNKQCWVLINKGKDKNPTTKGMPPKITWEQGFIRKLSNQTLDVLVNYLNWEMDSIPVIDESHFTQSFDMDLDTIINDKTGFLDIEKIKRNLNAYGFDLVRAVRPVDMLIIRDKKN